MSTSIHPYAAATQVWRATHHAADKRQAPAPRAEAYPAPRDLEGYASQGSDRGLRQAMARLSLAPIVAPVPNPCDTEFMETLSYVRGVAGVSVDQVTLDRDDIDRLVLHLGPDMNGIQRFIKTCVASRVPKVVLLEPAQQHLFDLLVQGGHARALASMLKTLSAEPLTCAAHTAALQRKLGPPPRLGLRGRDTAGSWLPLMVLRVHRPGAPLMVYGETPRAQSKTDLPPLRLFLGVPGAMHRLVILQPPAPFTPSVATGATHASKSLNESRPLVYIDTDQGQMCIERAELTRPWTGRGSHKSGRGEARQSLSEMFNGYLPTPDAADGAGQAFRFLDGQVVALSAMRLQRHQVSELLGWRGRAPSPLGDDLISELDLEEGRT